MDYSIQRLTGPRAYAQVEVLMDEYLDAIAQQITAVGVQHREAAMVADRHQFMRAELPGFVDGRGRLLAARDTRGWLGVGILKPVDAATAEIKRMYVRPEHRGRGIGRALIDELLDAARAEGFATVRLETMDVLQASIALYRSRGFQDSRPFTGSEVIQVGGGTNVRCMQLSLTTAIDPG